MLGIIVHPQRTREQVQQMLTSLLRAMQRTFPDRPLEVMAYDRSDDQRARLPWDPHTPQARMVWRRRLLTRGTPRVRALRAEGYRCGRWQSQA